MEMVVRLPADRRDALAVLRYCEKLLDFRDGGGPEGGGDGVPPAPVKPLAIVR